MDGRIPTRPAHHAPWDLPTDRLKSAGKYR